MQQEQVPVFYDSSQYLVTKMSNKISKLCFIRGTDNIHIEGKAILMGGTALRGDLAQINMGIFVIAKEDVILRPTFNKGKNGKLKYVSLSIGDYVFIDKRTIVCSFKIGNGVHIGKDCVIGHRSVLKDNCKILDGSVVPADTVIPPFTVWGGRPAVMVGELPETSMIIHKELAVQFFRNFQGV
jgi:dynactin-5